MTPTLHFSKDDTRESALRKAGAWYDCIADEIHHPEKVGITYFGANRDLQDV